MDRIDNVREQFEALEQQTEQLIRNTCPGERRRRWWRLPRWGAAMAALGLTLALPLSVPAETFRCSAGDVPCLIAAINAANANGDANTIRLAAGTYTLTAPDNPGNGLPVITSPLTLIGRGADNTSIERDASAPGFRILDVAATGSLTLRRLTLRRGGVGIRNEGTLTLVRTTVTANGMGGIVNTGTLTLLHSAVTSTTLGTGILTSGPTVIITHSTIAFNRTSTFSGGLQINGGTVTLRGTTVTRNFAQGTGGIDNGSFFGGAGTVIITESAITQNGSDNAATAAGITNRGTMVITNTTVSGNRNSGPRVDSTGGIINSGGTLLLTNSTLADNVGEPAIGPPGVGGIGGIRSSGGTVLLLNTILASNIGSFSPDCVGSITSLGTNLIGDPTGCTLTLQPSDLTGDPGLDAFTDNGRPGKGHFPLLSTSQAIDAGNDAVCPSTDQLGRRRIGPCDIGAIEFRDRDDRQHDEEDDEEDEQHDEDPATAAQASQGSP